MAIDRKFSDDGGAMCEYLEKTGPVLAGILTSFNPQYKPHSAASLRFPLFNHSGHYTVKLLLIPRGINEICATDIPGVLRKRISNWKIHRNKEMTLKKRGITSSRASISELWLSSERESLLELRSQGRGTSGSATSSKCCRHTT